MPNPKLLLGALHPNVPFNPHSRTHPLRSSCHLQIDCSAYATFIAVDTKTKRPRLLPPTATPITQPSQHDEPHLRLISQEQQLSRTLLDSFSVQRKQLSVNSTPQRDEHAIKYLQTISFKKVLHVDQTEVTIRKHFLPRNQNQAGLIFGGDILSTFEQAALTCASRMQSRRMVTVATRSIAFLAPVQPLSLLHVVARVVACTGELVVVLVRSYVDQEHNRFELQPSHQGVFYLRAADWQPVEVGVHAWNTAHEDDLHRVLPLPLPQQYAR